MSEKKDNWQQYATEREETAQAVIERHRGEIKSLLNLLAKDRGELQALRAQIGQGVPEVSTEHGPWVPSSIHEGETYCERCLLRSAFVGARECNPHIKESAPPAPQQKPLTDEQIVDAYCKERGMRQYVEAYVAGARFAEAAHNIGEKK